MPVKILLFVIWILVIPPVIGSIWSENHKTQPGSLLLAWFYGFFAEFALFEIIAVPMTFLSCSLTQLKYVWIFACLALTVFALVRCKSFPQTRRSIAALPKQLSLLLIVVLLLMLSQAVFLTLGQHLDSDDAFYLATAETAVKTDSLFRYGPYTGVAYAQLPSRYVLASWPLFLAVLSVLTGLHPTLLAHTLLPGLILLFAYLVFALIARSLFPEQKNRRALFLLIIVAVFAFFGFSIYTPGTFLMIRSWQGKAMIAAVAEPALFYLCRAAMKEKEGLCAWSGLFCAVTACCLFSSMGVVLSLIPVGVYTLIYSIELKHPRYIPQALICCIPAFVVGAAYLLIS